MANLKSQIQNLNVKSEDLNKLFTVALNSSRKASKFLMGRFGERKEYSRKKLSNSFDDSRKYIQIKEDEESEKIIKEEILKHFPNHGFLAEESEIKLAKYIWVIDPLCGTISYMHGLETWSVSIALLREGKIILGVVNCPVLEEEYCAILGGGVFCNGKNIRVSDTERLEDSLISIEHKILRKHQKYPKVTTELVTRIRRLRITESAGQELCYVASGKTDALIKANQPLYDFAAGKIILEEAGGEVTDFSGKPLKIILNKEIGIDILASNGKIHQKLLTYFPKKE